MNSEDFWKIRDTQINNCIVSCSYIVIIEQLPHNSNINSTYESYNLIHFSLIPHKAYF